MGSSRQAFVVYWEYVWGPGDHGVDEALVYYDATDEAWWCLTDLTGDLIALCDLGGTNGAARVVAGRGTVDVLRLRLRDVGLPPPLFRASGEVGDPRYVKQSLTPPSGGVAPCPVVGSSSQSALVPSNLLSLGWARGLCASRMMSDVSDFRGFVAS